METTGELLFNPEIYRDKVVDIVHIQSIERIVDGNKPSDPSVKNKAKLVARNIQQLRQANITIRDIENPSVFVPPSGQELIVLGGAFVGECLQDYIETAKKAGFNLRPDPLLSVELD
jgi:hypothetical protein